MGMDDTGRSVSQNASRSPNQQWLPVDSRPYTSTGSGPFSAQWVTNLQVLNQTADKPVEGEWVGGEAGAV